MVEKIICPDCGARMKDRRLTHENTCPVGLDLDRVMLMDARYFRMYPKKKFYERELSWGESIEMRPHLTEGDVPGTLNGRVRVYNITPGVRGKEPFDLWIAGGSV